MTTRVLTFVGWGLIAAALCAVQLAGMSGRRVASLGDVLRWLTRSRAGQLLALAGWLWVGWHVFVRSSR